MKFIVWLILGCLLIIFFRCFVLCSVVVNDVFLGSCRLISSLGWLEFGKNCCGISEKFISVVMNSVFVISSMMKCCLMY